MLCQTLLFVDEDERDLERMKLYFSACGYLVVTATNGVDGLIEAFGEETPDLIILNTILPDMNGYDFCHQLRGNDKTIRTPIIFLTERDARSEGIIGLELGQDSYITKPVDVEKLKFLIEFHLRLHSPLINAVTGCASGELLKAHLKELRLNPTDWAKAELNIQGYVAFKEIYGWHSGEEVLRTVAAILINACEAFGTENDFIAHGSEHGFTIISHCQEFGALTDYIKTCFDREIPSHYSFIDREQGGILMERSIIPLMSLDIQVVEAS